MNMTQTQTLARLLGDDAEQWNEKRIILAPATALNLKPTIAISARSETGNPAWLGWLSTWPGEP